MKVSRIKRLCFFSLVRVQPENIYENVSELKLSTGEDKVDGLGGTKEFEVWKATREQSADASPSAAEPSHCVLLRVKKNGPADGQTPKSGPTRGAMSYSSSASSSSYGSSTNSWGSRMKLAMQRKLSSGEGPASPAPIDEPTDK